MDKDKIINTIHYLILKHYTFEMILDKLYLNEQELLDYLNIINLNSNQKTPVVNIGGKPKIVYSKREFTIHNLENMKSKLKLMLISDKHIDHTDDRIDLINSAYNEADKRGVDYVFDLGDILNGPLSEVHNQSKVRTGTLEGSIEQLKKYHPDVIPTYFITGNHDLKFMLHDSCNIGQLIESECKNMIFLNNLFTCINIGNLHINLSHGSIENKHLSTIKLNKEYKFLTYNDPHIICQGHFHISGISSNQGVLLYQIPSLKYDKNLGAVFLTIKELSDEFEVIYEKMEFKNNKQQIKSEFLLKKTINY
ncbi:MAG: metallophosphoesterase family protein [Bacilli bacterium]|nr:metallophosphoesterase family protein [Bacilli bacterium]MDD3895870.1 metallophosphoesterase family protein [Bacilli bacterium]MDD4407555.1 metallophosphoesterase family protein [Bacilli bacterium]